MFKIVYALENYIVTALGESCQGLGLLPIGSIAACSSLVSIFRDHYPTISYRYQVYLSDRPSGCYAMTNRAWQNRDFGIYFNAHSSGAGIPETRALCKGLGGKRSIL